MDESDLLREFEVARADYQSAITLALIELAKRGEVLTVDEMRIADCASVDFRKIRSSIWQKMPLATRQEICALRVQKESLKTKLQNKQLA